MWDGGTTVQPACEITTEYYYSLDGYLLHKYVSTRYFDYAQPNITSSYSEGYVYQYKNGNLITSINTTPKGGTEVEKYTYTDLPNQLATIESAIHFEGKLSKNLIKTKEVIVSGGVPIITEYSYKFNTENQLESETTTTGNKKKVRNFAWKCN